MKRVTLLLIGAAFGAGMVPNGPALAFDGQATPPLFLASSLSQCAVMETEGYPNPGGSGCSDRSSTWTPEFLRSGRSVATVGRLCATPVLVCGLHHEALIGEDCSCRTAGGRMWGTVTR